MNRDVTRWDVLAVFIVLSVFLIPLTLVFIFKGNAIIDFLFLGWRIFIFWLSVYVVFFLFKKDIDKFFGVKQARTQINKDKN